MYSGYFYGIVPNQDGISWESHLFGAIVGVFVAFILKDLVEPSVVKENPWQYESEDVIHYLSRDQFDFTKEERRILEERRLDDLRRNTISTTHDSF